MKNSILVVTLVVLLFSVSGCRNRAERGELAEFKLQASQEEQSRKLVQNYFEELNRGNVGIINTACAPEYLFYSPSISPRPLSREDTAAFIQTIFKSFPDVNWRIKELLVDGETAIIWNVVTGTHQGEFAGVPPTGKRVEVSSVLLWHFKDGKIVEEREEADMLGLMQQLGLELKPKAAENK